MHGRHILAYRFSPRTSHVDKTCSVNVASRQQVPETAGASATTPGHPIWDTCAITKLLLADALLPFLLNVAGITGIRLCGVSVLRASCRAGLISSGWLPERAELRLWGSVSPSQCEG